MGHLTWWQWIIVAWIALGIVQICALEIRWRLDPERPGRAQDLPFWAICAIVIVGAPVVFVYLVYLALNERRDARAEAAARPNRATTLVDLPNPGNGSPGGKELRLFAMDGRLRALLP
jgi:hypothetical protein